MLEPLDPNNPATWVNAPCPVDLRPIQEELTKVGGLNRFGEPNFIIVWAQEYRTFDCGQMRIHFDEQLIPAIQTPTRYAVRPDVFERAVAWLNKQNELRKQAYMNLDWKAFNKLPDIKEYLEANELSEGYMLLPSNDEDLGRMARMLPDGWMYINGLHKFEHIGEQAFYVLQWFPPEAFKGGREGWDIERFTRAYVPELDNEEEFVDVIGDFPTRGNYELPVIRIANRVKAPMKHEVLVGVNNDYEYSTYKTPTIANVVEPLKELLRRRDELTDAEKDPNKRNEARMKDFVEGMPERRESWGKRFREMFRAAKPVGGGNPTNISSNKTKS